ncbi:MAG TPA: DPP IV N-terminal domain-containing protein [Blastocatellia bacterium]|nr:DPP IV N-terminal domain-containing protein [Blastocatellia bacterium]
MKTNENPLASTGNRSKTQVRSRSSVLLAQFLRLKKQRITLLPACICVAVFAFALYSVHADLRPLSESARDDADAFGGPPQSIAFHSSREGNNEVYVMNPDGSEQTRLTTNSRNDGRPNISPNGKQIVFASNRIIPETNPSGDFEVFVMNSDGSDVRQLTFNGAEDSWPRWSPNGKWIAFHSIVDGNFEIYVIRPDGTDLTRVTDYAGLDQYPEWSPNGKQLAIRRDTDIYLIDLDGANPLQLTAGNIGFNQMASWSPDGKRLAFLSTREGYPSVFVMDADGSNQVNLTPKPDDVLASSWSSRAPGWSRNGQYIYFTARRPEVSVNENIFVMNAEGTGVTQLTFTLAPGVSAEAAVR